MTHRILISLTEEEHRFLRRAAKAEGVRLGLKMPVATFVRRAAVYAGRSLLETLPDNNRTRGDEK